MPSADATQTTVLTRADMVEGLGLAGQALEAASDQVDALSPFPDLLARAAVAAYLQGTGRQAEADLVSRILNFI